MGCAFSKPQITEKELITIDQLERELFKFQNNVRGYWRRKKTFCLRRVKPKNDHSPTSASREPVVEEKRPSVASNSDSSEKINVTCDDKPGKCQEENDVGASTYSRTSNEIKQDSPPLRSAYSKTEPIRIPGWFPLETRHPASKSLPLQERKLSESSQAAAADVVLTTKSAQDIQEKCTVLRELHVDNLYHPSKHYDLVKKIGEGSFGSVHLAKHKQTQDKEYAIKCIPLKNSDKKNLVTEVEVLRQCSHENILALTDSYLTDECLFLVTDYVPGVSVFTMIDETGGVTEKIIASVMKEALQGLAYLHGQGYIHCDVKSDNILVGVNRQVIIADFGLAVKMTETRPRGFRGSMMFTSPEMANRLPYGSEIDIWSLGIVAIEMFQGYPPLEEADSKESFIRMSRSGYSNMNEEAKSMASEVFLDFLYNGALRYIPAERPTANELLNHPFLLRGDDCQSLPLVVGWVMQGEVQEEMENDMQKEMEEEEGGKEEMEEEGKEEMEEEEEEYCWMKSWGGSG